MLIGVFNFPALWDAWEFTEKIIKNKNLIEKPTIINRRNKVTVLIKLKKQ